MQQQRERRTRAERSDRFEQNDTVNPLRRLNMSTQKGHAYDWQDAEVGMFKEQQFALIGS